MSDVQIYIFFLFIKKKKKEFMVNAGSNTPQIVHKFHAESLVRCVLWPWL